MTSDLALSAAVERPQVRFLGHATNSIELDGVRILTDPVVRQRVTFLGRITTPLVAADYQDHDVVVISHLHYDHCDIRSLRLVDAPVVVVPSGAGEYLYRKGVKNLVELEVGASIRHENVTITAVPALHDGSRIHARVRAAAVGYVVTGASGSLYFAGDTDIFPEMSAIPEIAGGDLDLALLPVWGWGPNLGSGHMNPERAAQALTVLDPTIAMPIHWGTYFPVGMGTLLPQKRWVLSRPPLDFAQCAANRGLQDLVRVTQPGDYLEWQL